jgi:hypothetical protein
MGSRGRNSSTPIGLERLPRSIRLQFASSSGPRPMVFLDDDDPLPLVSRAWRGSTDRGAGQTPVARAEPPVGPQCALARGARTVAIEYLAAPPTREPHEVALATSAREPAVGKGMPQLVRTETVSEPGLPATLADDLRDPAVGQPAYSAGPQPGKIGVGRALPHPDVPIEGTHGLCPDGNHALAAPLPEHPQDALVEVDVIRRPAGLVPDMAGPRVYEMAELVRSYLRAVGKHRLLVPAWMPGRAARAFRHSASTLARTMRREAHLWSGGWPHAHPRLRRCAGGLHGLQGWKGGTGDRPLVTGWSHRAV